MQKLHFDSSTPLISKGLKYTAAAGSIIAVATIICGIVAHIFPLIVLGVAFLASSLCNDHLYKKICSSSSASLQDKTTEIDQLKSQIASLGGSRYEELQRSRQKEQELQQTLSKQQEEITNSREKSKNIGQVTAAYQEQIESNKKTIQELKDSVQELYTALNAPKPNPQTLATLKKAVMTSIEGPVTTLITKDEKFLEALTKAQEEYLPTAIVP